MKPYYYSLLLLILAFSTHSLEAQFKDRYQVLFKTNAFFKPGDAKLQKKYHKHLDSIPGILAEQEVETIIIQAHTDSIGTTESNEKLAYDRASSIVEYLKKKGVDVNLLEITTYGEYNPIANNNTEEGRAKNRRVSISLLSSPQKGGSAKIQGQILDTQSNMPLDSARILLVYLGGLDTLYSDASGRFERDFDYFTNVEVRVYAKNYFFASKLAKFEGADTLNMEFKLEPAIIGGKMFLSDLYFKPGTALLLPSSARALEGIKVFMEYNDQLRFEIGGHINKPNAERVNPRSNSFQLSEDRAKAVYLYLIEEGIAEERLQYQGYGNWEMIHPEATTELQMQMNRRVELKIIE